MRAVLLATSIFVMPSLAFAQAEQCLQPRVAPQPQLVSEASPPAPESAHDDQTFILPPPVNPTGPMVPLSPAQQRAVAVPAPHTVASTPPAPNPSVPPLSGSVRLRSPHEEPDAHAAEDVPALSPMTAAQIAASPALGHIATRGATLSDLGVAHGLRTVVAVNEGQFISFVVAPDGQALVQGLMTDITLPQLQAIAGSNLTDLPTLHGMRTVFLRNADHYQVFYSTPDGERLIPGVMWDSAGKDLTHDQIADIPGTVPTVVIAPDAAVPAATAAATPARDAAPQVAANFDDVAKAVYSGSAGVKADAPEIMMFMDPLCPFSIRAMSELSPSIAKGVIRLTVIPLSFIDAEDDGKSTVAALSLLSVPSAQLVDAWVKRSVSDAPAPAAQARLAANMQVAHVLDVRGTPTLLWRKPDGTVGRINGLPPNLPAVLAQLKG